MTVTYATGYAGTRRTLAELKAWSKFAGVHPEVQRRAIAMMDAAKVAGIDLGVGGGFRSSAEQLALFDSRHDPVASGGCCSYNGKRWALVTGAHAAPPGLSYHEETVAHDGRRWGVALDMINHQSGWMDKNAAAFGLRTFTNVNGEPWHVQPVELPTARSEYDKSPGTFPLKTWPLPAPAPSPNPVIDVPTPTIRSGSTGEQVKKLQSQMRFWGWYPYAIDGSAGARTVEGIKKLQAAVKVGADGVYGPVTADAYRRWLTAMAGLA